MFNQDWTCKGISIHALREEGDSPLMLNTDGNVEFLSTPSARRATFSVRHPIHQTEFLSTPSARRATRGGPSERNELSHFYPRPPRGGRRSLLIKSQRQFVFLSTPSARRATTYEDRADSVTDISIHALREEGDPPACQLSDFFPISIHALREEGDAECHLLPEEKQIFLSTPSARRATLTLLPSFFQ